MPSVNKQNLTISLSPETIRKVKVLAAKRATSIGKLVAEHVEAIIGADDEYERAKRSAIARMERGFHMGTGPIPTRDEIYDR